MSAKRKWALVLAAALLLGLCATAQAAAPQVSCVGATNIGTHSAQLNGYVSGASVLHYTQKGVYLSSNRTSLMQNRYTAGLSQRQCAFAFSFGASETESLCGSLRAGTIYYYKLFVVSNGKEYVSEMAWFRTADEKTDGKTVLSAYDAAEVTMNDALLCAKVTKNDYKLKFSRISLLLGTSASALKEAAGMTPANAAAPEARFQVGQYTALNPLTTYYYQFCVATASGASYVSAVKSFTTTAPYVRLYLEPGAGLAPGVMQATPGGYYTLPVPAQAGYTFAGWYTMPAGGMPIAQNGIWAYTYDMTLYGSWVQSGASTGTQTGSQQLLFDANHDNLGVVESKTVKAGKKYGTLPELTRAGYKCKGWYTAATGGVKVSSSTRAEAAGTVTLYALWSPRSYKVTFNADGGSVSPASSTLRFGETYVLPTPVREGYAFLGWYAANGTQPIPQTWVMNVASKLTLYAKWAPYGVSVPGGLMG